MRRHRITSLLAAVAFAALPAWTGAQAFTAFAANAAQALGPLSTLGSGMDAFAASLDRLAPSVARALDEAGGMDGFDGAADLSELLRAVFVDGVSAFTLLGDAWVNQAATLSSVRGQLGAIDDPIEEIDVVAIENCLTRADGLRTAQGTLDAARDDLFDLRQVLDALGRSTAGAVRLPGDAGSPTEEGPIWETLREWRDVLSRAVDTPIAGPYASLVQATALGYLLDLDKAMGGLSEFRRQAENLHQAIIQRIDAAEAAVERLERGLAEARPCRLVGVWRGGCDFVAADERVPVAIVLRRDGDAQAGDFRVTEEVAFARQEGEAIAYYRLPRASFVVADMVLMARGGGRGAFAIAFEVRGADSGSVGNRFEGTLTSDFRRLEGRLSEAAGATFLVCTLDLAEVP